MKRLRFWNLFIIFGSLLYLTVTLNTYPSGKIVSDKIVSEALKDNKLGDPNIRNLLIYLPPAYETGAGEFPTVYLLHGFGGNERSFVSEVGENFVIFLLDNMIESGMLKQMIIVMPDARTKYGGSFYLNSVLSGNYEDYIVNEIVNYVDNKYRTIRSRLFRAIAGASMGGYGAVTLSMKHPDKFSIVAAMSPPLSFDVISEKMIPQVIKENPNGMSGPNSKKQYTDYLYALSAALSPNLDNPPFFVDIPFTYPEGNIIEAIREKWSKGDPLSMLSKYSDSLRSMKGIYIDIGTRDLLGFKESADIFHNQLLSLGIKHEYYVFDGGHSDKGVDRAIRVLTFISDLIEADASPVDKNNKTTTWGKIKLSW